MQTKQAYEKKVEKKLHLFWAQIETLHAFEDNAGRAFNRKIYYPIWFLKQKQKALEIQFQLFQEAEGIVWQEMKKGRDALMKDMICSISKVHSECIQVTY